MNIKHHEHKNYDENHYDNHNSNHHEIIKDIIT